jgi:hypothetical protein
MNPLVVDPGFRKVRCGLRKNSIDGAGTLAAAHDQNHF